jgi:hypothetical protein
MPHRAIHYRARSSMVRAFTMAMPVLPSCGVLLGQQEAVAKLVRIGIETFTRQNLPPGAGGQEARVCHRLGLLAMAGELATRNGILPWPEGEATRAAKAIFADWLAARGGIGAAEDRAAVQQVAGFLAVHGASRFQPITGRLPPSLPTAPVSGATTARAGGNS